MRFIKRKIGKFIIAWRLRRTRKVMYNMMRYVFVFTKESKDQGYDPEWIYNQLDKANTNDSSGYIQRAMYLAVGYGYATNLSLDEFSKIIWKELTDIDKETLRKVVIE